LLPGWRVARQKKYTKTTADDYRNRGSPLLLQSRSLINLNSLVLLVL
jgi:hypothetical protein